MLHTSHHVIKLEGYSKEKEKKEAETMNLALSELSFI